MKTLKQELIILFGEKFKEQMGLNISDILTITNGKYYISSDNKMGLSIASLKLDLSDKEHGKMSTFLTLISEDNTFYI